MTIREMTYKLSSLFAGALLALSCGSCINDSALCVEDRPGYKEGDDLWISFKINNMGEMAKTRADQPSDSSDHPVEEAGIAENYINVDDISLMFFDNNKQLLKVFQPGEYTVNPTDNTDYSQYELILKINRGYFSYASSQKYVNYSLMMVVNSKSIDSSCDSFTEILFAMTPEQISNLYKKFAMPEQTEKAWLPTTDGTRQIPMAGIMTGSFETENLYEDHPKENPIELGELYLQRCLAKIRVLDAIPLQKDTDAKIKEVKLSGYNTYGAFIPTVSDSWFSSTTVLEKATENSEWYNESNSVVFENTDEERTSVADGTTTYSNEFYCYIPELVVTGRDTKLLITVEFTNPNENEENKTRDFELKLADTGITDIVRNHIYEYIISIRDAEMTLKWTVCPMDQEEISIPPFN